MRNIFSLILLSVFWGLTACTLDAKILSEGLKEVGSLNPPPPLTYMETLAKNFPTIYGDSVYRINLDSTNRLVIGGDFSWTLNNSSEKHAFTRIKTDRTLNENFHFSHGIMPLTAMNPYINFCEVQNGNNLWLAGATAGPLINGTNYNGKAIRLNNLGLITGVSNGVHSFMISRTGGFWADIITSGPSKRIIQKLDENAQPISSTIELTTSSSIEKAWSDGADGIFIAGYNLRLYGEAQTYSLIHILSDGQFDTNFASFTQASFPNSPAYLAPTGDGRYFIFIDYGSEEGLYIYNSNGTLDQTLSSPTGSISNIDFVFTTSSSIYWMTSASQKFIKTNFNGIIDSTFIEPFTGLRSYSFAQILNDGTMVVNVSHDTSLFTNNENISELYRINPTTGAIVEKLGYISTIGLPQKICETDDGDINLIGSIKFFSSHIQKSSRLLRLTDDGKYDSSFATGDGFDNLVSSFVIAPDDSIIVVGNFNLYNNQTASKIVWLNTNGTIRSDFNGGANSTVKEILALKNGDYIIGGSFSTLGPDSPRSIAYIQSNGTIKTSFNDGSSLRGFNANVTGLCQVTTDAFFASGNFTEYKDHTGLNQVVKLNIDGSLNLSFTSPSFASSSVMGITCTENHLIVFLGYDQTISTHTGKIFFLDPNTGAVVKAISNPNIFNWPSTGRYIGNNKIVVGSSGGQKIHVIDLTTEVELSLTARSHGFSSAGIDGVLLPDNQGYALTGSYFSTNSLQYSHGNILLVKPDGTVLSK